MIRNRIVTYQVGRRMADPGARAVVQLLFGLLAAGAVIALRLLLDIWAPNTGPFALAYPGVLLATLFGTWRAGTACLVVTVLWAWYVVLPLPYSFAFEMGNDPQRVVINTVSIAVVALFAEFFRSAVQGYAEESETALERRLTLLAELEHRTKNNFALVASLLEIQKRREGSPELNRKLDDAIGRIRTFADAYSNLQLEQQEGADVMMRPYLTGLVDRIGRASFSDAVEVHCTAVDVVLPREIAVAIGLYVNEALTNCAKYAFADGRAGSIQVHFAGDTAAWALDVEDDGAGATARSDAKGGLGSDLLDAFARQARAAHKTSIDDRGCKLSLRAIATG